MKQKRTILNQLLSKPALYAGDAKISSIYHFLQGYQFSIEQNGIKLQDDSLIIPRDFHDWVAYRLHFYESTSGWCRMIYKRAKTEEEALDRFKELIEEFENREPTIVARLMDFKKTYTTQLISKNKSEIEYGSIIEKNFPRTITLLTYTNDPGFFLNSEASQDFPHKGFCPSLDSFETRFGISKTDLKIIDRKWATKEGLIT